MGFSKSKFLALPVQQQHKKCAESLRVLYLSEGENSYTPLQEWLGLPSLDTTDRQDIADRYHEHLKLANISLKEHNLLPRQRCGDRCQSKNNVPCHVYLDKIRSAHNVGSILRTIEAFSMGNCYFHPQTPFIDHNQVKQAAMGAHEWITALPCPEPAALPRPLIALETSPHALNLYDYLFPETFTLALGNEEYGCSEEVLRDADIILEIPLTGRKNSLNVANAFAIAAGEIIRQRHISQGSL